MAREQWGQFSAFLVVLIVAAALVYVLFGGCITLKLDPLPALAPLPTAVPIPTAVPVPAPPASAGPSVFDSAEVWAAIGAAVYALLQLAYRIIRARRKLKGG